MTASPARAGDASLSAIRSATPQADAYFGGAVAANGDHLLVGAPQQAALRGVAQLFRIEASGPALVSTLSPADGAPGDRLGQSVAMDAQVIAVGAPSRNSGTGAVRVYARNGSGSAGALQTVLSPDPVAGDQFGAALAVGGSWLFVSETGDDGPAGANTGAVHAFRRAPDGQFVAHARLVCPEPQANTFFGMALSTDGSRLVIGARMASLGAEPQAGGTWVYELAADGAIGDAVRLVPPDLQANDWFGQAVAVEGDRVAVGACRDSIGPVSAQGSVRVFERDRKGAWSQVAALFNPAGQSLDRYGTSVALHGGRIAVGADGEDRGGVDAAGSIHVLEHASGDRWMQRAFGLPAATPAQFLGIGVALTGTHVFGGAPKHQVAGGPLREGVVGAAALSAPCPADLDGSGSIDAADLALLLSAWGAGAGAADLDGDALVGAADLAVLLAAWGPC